MEVVFLPRGGGAGGPKRSEKETRFAICFLLLLLLFFSFFSSSSGEERARKAIRCLLLLLLLLAVLQSFFLRAFGACDREGSKVGVSARLTRSASWEKAWERERGRERKSLRMLDWRSREQSNVCVFVDDFPFHFFISTRSPLLSLSFFLSLSLFLFLFPSTPLLLFPFAPPSDLGVVDRARAGLGVRAGGLCRRRGGGRRR